MSAFAIALFCGCSSETQKAHESTDSVELTVVATTDLHGELGRLPLLAGYLELIRNTQPNVILIDSGDMFQGTLVSNLSEGAAIVEAYEKLRYDAAAVGNHEFDFGPVGPDSHPTQPSQDPRGALAARASQANFPFLAANIESKGKGLWSRKNIEPFVMIERGGLDVAIIGATTMATPRTTSALNFKGLEMRPLAEAITQYAGAARKKGADVVIAAVHAGGDCKDFSNPNKLDSCATSESFELARALQPGLVDVIAGGHSHRGTAHIVNGIAVVQAFAHGKAFSRVDLRVSKGEVELSKVHAPMNLCTDHRASVQDCVANSYEGRAPSPSAEFRSWVEIQQDKVAAVANRSLGVTLSRAFKRSRSDESSVGNFVVDYMLKARPQAQVAITNGGGLRASMPSGELTYRDLYEVIPFDNRFAFISITGAELTAIITKNVSSRGSFLSVGGVTAKVSCEPKLKIALLYQGKQVSPSDVFEIVTNDFLANGGDGLFASVGISSSRIRVDNGETIRDAIARVLGDGPTELRPEQFFTPSKPRIRFPGRRPACRNAE